MLLLHPVYQSWNWERQAIRDSHCSLNYPVIISYLCGLSEIADSKHDAQFSLVIALAKNIGANLKADLSSQAWINMKKQAASVRLPEKRMTSIRKNHRCFLSVSSVSDHRTKELLLRRLRQKNKQENQAPPTNLPQQWSMLRFVVEVSLIIRILAKILNLSQRDI